MQNLPSSVALVIFCSWAVSGSFFINVLAASFTPCWHSLCDSFGEVWTLWLLCGWLVIYSDDAHIVCYEICSGWFLFWDTWIIWFYSGARKIFYQWCQLVQGSRSSDIACFPFYINTWPVPLTTVWALQCYIGSAMRVGCAVYYWNIGICLQCFYAFGWVASRVSGL